MSGIAFKTNFSSHALKGISELKKAPNAFEKPNGSDNKEGGASFMDHLKQGISDINKSDKIAEKLSSDVAAGKNQNLHESMLAITQAELGFNFMVQVRNKALEAYSEISRMQV